MNAKPGTFDASAPPAPLLDDKNELTPIFLSTVHDLFRKFDMVLTDDISYGEFNALMSRVGVHCDEPEFESKYLV
ncbi:MAG: hypothetical protein V2I33_24770 [Kangiellaceae bacterium]|jgi:hypothetical protein|nr:hypothetical protein [Kangiellaceae bacterium]